MLQQTRVETVLPYYERFLAAFPTVRALAASSPASVLRCWQGLGYYTRARNLHRAAQTIVAQRGGRLPESAAEWRNLPGVGRYTANAIASIAAGEAVPVVDGNVQRVLARLFAIRACIDDSATQTRLWQLAEMLLARRAAGAFNQALMELGARICTARRPSCTVCPLRSQCRARAEGLQERLPVRRSKRPPRQVELVAAWVRHAGRLLLVRRPAAGLLAGLWTLPGTEVRDGQPPARVLRASLRQALGIEAEVGERIGLVRHAFSHRRWVVHVYACRLSPRRRPVRAAANMRWVDRAQLGEYALAAVDRKLLALAR